MKTVVKLYFWAENIWFKLPEKLRFLLVGGFNTVFAFGVLAALLWCCAFINGRFEFTRSEALVANISLFMQYIITINVSFLTMRYYVFQSNGDWKREYVKAWSVYVLIYFINAPVMTFLIVFLHLHPLAAQAVYLIFSTVLTFLLHKYYSFRRKKPDSARK